MPVYGAPGYHQGFARNASESKRPNLWKGLVFCGKPSLGVTGMTLRDVSGYNNHGTLTNMNVADWVISNNSKLPGYALDFDGIEDQITTLLTDSILSGNSPFAYSTWVKTTDTVGVIIGGGKDSNNIFELFIDGDGKAKFLRNIAGSNNKTAGVSISDNIWHYIVGTYDGVNIKFYKDGVFDTQTGSSASYTPDGSTVVIGARITGTIQYAGLMDDIRIYSRALYDAEIQDMYQHPNAMFELAPRFEFRVPDVAPSTRRIMMISQYINSLIEQCYFYN